MKRYKLTPLARVLVFVFVVALVGVGGYFGFRFAGSNNTKAANHVSDSSTGSKKYDASNVEVSSFAGTTVSDDKPVAISLDEWIGWDTAIYANGGLETQPGSINDKNGIKVKYYIMNDAEDSSNALIKGDLMGAGYTTNRTAFLSAKFKEAGMPVVMPVFTNYSSGGDGIIAVSDIKSVDDFVNAKIGVPKYSEAQTLVAWFVQKSDLSGADKKKILDNLVLMDDANQTGAAFFSGNLDVAATWQPYLSQAESGTNSKILFDTKSSRTLVVDGIVFRKDFADANSDWVTRYIKGILQARESHQTPECAKLMKNTLPMLADTDIEEVIDQMGDAQMCSYVDMESMLADTGKQTYRDMCDVWKSLGEDADETQTDTIFDSSYLIPLKSEFKTLDDTISAKATITDEKKAAIKSDTDQIDYPAMLRKTTMVTFVPNTVKFMDNAEAEAELREFVEIAKVIDGAIIKIEGNINSRNGVEGGQQLSDGRASTVAQFLIANGIDGSRIVTVGNDNRKPIVDPDAPDCEKNRRTDISFISSIE